MEALEQIPVSIHIDFPMFVSARTMADFAALTEWAVFEHERSELEYLKQEFHEIPAVTYDAALLRLHRKRGNAFLITEAGRGSVLLGGMAAGLAIWILDRTLGETLKNAWLESDLHERLKDLLLGRFGYKKKALADAIQKQLAERGIEAELEVTDEGIRVYAAPREDKEISRALHAEAPPFKGAPVGM